MTNLSTLLTEDVIEAAARAALEQDAGYMGSAPNAPQWTWDNVWDENRDYWRRKARAALSAALPMIVEMLQKQ
jgi:hypothetical protein